jgi:hypothetical protein
MRISKSDINVAPDEFCDSVQWNHQYRTSMRRKRKGKEKQLQEKQLNGENQTVGEDEAYLFPT